MHALITYKLDFIPHPFKSSGSEMKAWCLVKVVTPQAGPTTYEPVAIFNLDSEAEIFAGHVMTEGLADRLVELHEDHLEVLKARESLRQRGGNHP